MGGLLEKDSAFYQGLGDGDGSIERVFVTIFVNSKPEIKRSNVHIREIETSL